MTAILESPRATPAKVQEVERPGFHIPEIDGLRAIAVLMVLFSHAFKYSATVRVRVPDLGWHLLMNLAHGVDLFFVVSGVCLSYPILARLQSTGTLKFDAARYASKRLLRIIPPYYAAIAIFVLLYACLTLAGIRLPETMTAHTPIDMLREVFFLDKGTSFLNGSFWTLSVEFRWYIVFPLLLLAFARSRVLFGVLAVAFLLLYHETRDAAVDFGMLPAFMLGIVAAYLRLNPKPALRYALSACAIAMFAAVASDPQTGDFYFQDKLPWQLAMFFLVVGAGCTPWLRSVLSWRPLAFIGLTSYSVYLIHEPIVELLETRLHIPWSLAAAGGLVAGIAFWAMCERIIEDPTRKNSILETIEPRVRRALTRIGLPPRFSVDSTEGQ